MTKRIVSGVFLLIALGALGLILAGALTSGEQLIVRFLTAIIVAALGLYVISDLRLQAEDNGTAAGTPRTTTITSTRAATSDPLPANSTAAFMATVTGKKSASTSDLDDSAHAPSTVEGNTESEPGHTLPAVAAGHDHVEQTEVIGHASSPAVTGEYSLVAHGAVGDLDDVDLDLDDASPFEEDDDLGLWPLTPDGKAVTQKDPSEMDEDEIENLVAIFAKKTEQDLVQRETAMAMNGANGYGSDEPTATSLGLGDLVRNFHSNGNGASNGNGNGPHANGNGNDLRGAEGDGYETASHDPIHDDRHRGDVSSGDLPTAEESTTGLPTTGLPTTGPSATDLPPLDLSPTGLPTAADKGSVPGGGVTPEIDDGAVDAVTISGNDISVNDDLGNVLDGSAEAVPDNHGDDHHSQPAAIDAEEGSAAESIEVIELDENVAALDGSGDETVTTDDPKPSASAERVSYSLDPIVDFVRRNAAEGDGLPDALEAAIREGETEVISSLLDQGVLSGEGPLSDQDVRTMVYVAFTSNELRKILAAGGKVDGDNSNLDLGPIEVFPNESIPQIEMSSALAIEAEKKANADAAEIDLRDDAMVAESQTDSHTV